MPAVAGDEVTEPVAPVELDKQDVAALVGLAKLARGARSPLQVVQVTAGDGRLVVQVTDSYVLARACWQHEGSAGEPVSVVVDAGVLVDALGSVKSGGRLEVTPAGVCVSSGAVTAVVPPNAHATWPNIETVWRTPEGDSRTVVFGVGRPALRLLTLLDRLAGPSGCVKVWPAVDQFKVFLFELETDGFTVDGLMMPVKVDPETSPVPTFGRWSS